MDLSIVIPLFNERDSLRPLHDELVRVLAPLGRAYEILFIDDGSTDGSLDVLREIKARDEHVRVLSLAKNSGQTAALACGLKKRWARSWSRLTPTARTIRPTFRGCWRNSIAATIWSADGARSDGGRRPARGVCHRFAPTR